MKAYKRFFDTETTCCAEWVCPTAHSLTRERCEAPLAWLQRQIRKGWTGPDAVWHAESQFKRFQTRRKRESIRAHQRRAEALAWEIYFEEEVA